MCYDKKYKIIIKKVEIKNLKRCPYIYILLCVTFIIIIINLKKIKIKIKLQCGADCVAFCRSPAWLHIIKEEKKKKKPCIVIEKRTTEWNESSFKIRASTILTKDRLFDPAQPITVFFSSLLL